MVSFRLTDADNHDVKRAIAEAEQWLKSMVTSRPVVYLILNGNCNICMTPSMRGAHERDALLLGKIHYEHRKKFFKFVPDCLETRSNTALSRAIVAAVHAINRKESANGSTPTPG